MNANWMESEYSKMHNHMMYGSSRITIVMFSLSAIFKSAYFIDDGYNVDLVQICLIQLCSWIALMQIMWQDDGQWLIEIKDAR